MRAMKQRRNNAYHIFVAQTPLGQRRSRIAGPTNGRIAAQPGAFHIVTGVPPKWMVFQGMKMDANWACPHFRKPINSVLQWHLNKSRNHHALPSPIALPTQFLPGHVFVKKSSWHPAWSDLWEWCQRNEKMSLIFIDQSLIHMGGFHKRGYP